MRRCALVGMVVSACSFEHGSFTSIDDAPPLRMDVRSDVPLGAWTPPVDIGISSGENDDDPSLTDDMLEIFWGSRRTGGAGLGDENIYHATRTAIGQPWSTPASINELNTGSSETTMKVSGDGLTIYFTSDRAGNNDIYVSTRTSRTALWGSPVRVAELSTGGGDWAAYVQRNNKHLVLCSGPTTSAEALYTSDRSVTQEPWSPPVKINELDETNVSECDPMEPKKDSTVMYYSSWRQNVDMTYDIYRVDRAAAGMPWGNRTAVDGINSVNHHDRDPWVSEDERTIFFSSTRDGSGVDKIYMSTR